MDLDSSEAIGDSSNLYSYGGYFDANFAGTNNQAGNLKIYGTYSKAGGNLGTAGTTAHYGGYYSVSGTADNNYGLWLDVSGATNNYGIVLDADNKAGGIMFGEGQDASIYYDGTDLIVDPDEVGFGKLKVMGDTDLSNGKTTIAYDTAFNEVAAVFEKFPDISIDFGLMEKADNVVVAKALFDWDDIGSWDSLDRIKKKNNDGNIIEGITSLHDVANSTIINQSTDNKIIVAGIGLDNFVIVVTDDAVLVCPKDRVQEVKQCVKQIRESDNDKWL